MPSIVEGKGDVGGDFIRPFIPNPNKILQTFYGVFNGVDGFKWGQVLALALFVDILNVILLNFGAVAQHDGT